MPEYLYIHIPFCIKKCIYCDFISIPYDGALSNRYIDTLKKEIMLREGDKLKTVYIGGGTPSLLPETAFTEIFHSLKSSFEFYPDIEITVEANPGTVDVEKIKALLDLGVNRLSIGVQSFSDAELVTLGRIHNSAEALKAVEAVRACGLENFSLDLIYGIPGQTSESWKETVSKALELKPVHISAYELTPEKATPLYRFLEEGKLKMPDEDTVLDMFNYAIDAFQAGGYRRYEVSNYAFPGYECLHNINYWKRGEYMGVGASAHSFVHGRRSKNTGDIFKYMDFLSKGRLPIEEDKEVSSEDALKEHIFLGLRLTEGIDMKKFKEEPGLNLKDAAEELIDEGLMELNADYLRLTRKGLLISNSIIVKIFREIGL